MEFIETYCGFSIFKDADGQYIAKNATETLVEKGFHDIFEAVTLYNICRPV